MQTDISDDLEAAAEEAWFYALPLIEFAGARARGAALGARLNRFVSLPNLADHRSRMVTTPNNDTLYASAQLDLGAGPLTLTIPPSGERYVSLALMDAYTNNIAVLGTRTLGPEGGHFRLIGPDDPGGEPHTIRMPTRHVWALARIMVDDEADLPAARAVQAGFVVAGPEAPNSELPASRNADWRSYFASADRLLALNPPPVTDLGLLRRIARLKLGHGRFDSASFSNFEQDAIARGVERASATIGRRDRSGSQLIGGWHYPDRGLGKYGQAYQLRAQIALTGLGALPPEEAVYMRAQGPDRGLFDGLQLWQMHFPAGECPPVDAFWSLSLYEPTDDGQFFFTENTLRRYAIGSRTKGLMFNADGSLDLWIGNKAPDADRLPNWLPAPAGPFALFMRAYLPKPNLQNGQYRLPPVELI
jgi:hypothetical protein